LPENEVLPKALILVGGPGTRLQPLTNDTPKSMLPVLNRPFMEYTIAYLSQHGVKDIILTLSYLPDAFREYFGDGSRFGVSLTYCLEKEPLGTAGAVRNAAEHLNSTFLVLNGDIFTDLDITSMLAFHREKGARATISLNWVDNPGAFGVLETDDDQRVKRFVEKPPPGEETSNWINAGTYILEPEVLEHIPPSTHYMFETGLFPLLLEMDKPVYGYPFRGYWLDMGNPEKYLALNRDLLQSKAANPVPQVSTWEGIYCEEGASIDPTAIITAPAAIGREARIGWGVSLNGPVVIGRKCQIEYGAVIEDAVLCGNVSVGPLTRISHSVIGRDMDIAPNTNITDSVVTSSQKVPLSQEM
jgi:mannose-1-phosphate guanylyltransferase